MTDFGRARSLMQGILLLIVSPVGLLGLAAQFTSNEGDSTGLAIMFGTITPLAIALGIWLILRSRGESDVIDAEIVTEEPVGQNRQ